MLHQMPQVVLFSHLVPRSNVPLVGAKDSSEELGPCGQEKPCAVFYELVISYGTTREWFVVAAWTVKSASIASPLCGSGGIFIA